MSVIDPNFRLYLYELRCREFEKTAAGVGGAITGGIRKALRGGFKKTLKKGWKPALLAGAVGVPLWAGAKVMQSSPPTSKAQQHRSARSQALLQGAGRGHLPQYTASAPRNPFRR